MATIIPMPSRGDRSAPTFNTKQPHELCRYFVDLEFMFDRAGVIDRVDKKRHTCRYVDIDTSELWETLDEYSNAAKSFDDFKIAVHALYPGSDEERRWSVADMDQLVGEWSHLGITSLGQLGEYHRSFLTITMFLRSKNRLSEVEQSRAFVRGFSPDLWRTISWRLQLKHPDHFPDDLYPLTNILEAAQYVLHGTPTAHPTSATFATPIDRSNQSDQLTEVNTEEFTAILERITNTFVKALTAATQRSERSTQSTQSNANCNFCDELGHFNRECLVAVEYISAGKCRRDQEGRIVLSNGASIPHDILGKCLKDRIDEWHRRIANGQLMYSVLSQDISNNSQDIVAPHEVHSDVFGATPTPSCVLSVDHRIASLERELYQLHHRQSNERKAREPTVEAVEEKSPKSIGNQPGVRSVSPSPILTPSQSLKQKKPVANSPYPCYTPPLTHNFAAAPKHPSSKKVNPVRMTSCYDTGKIYI